MNDLEILYVASIVRNDFFQQLFLESNKKIGNVGQKYHQLFCQGLSQNLNKKITVISQPPSTKNSFRINETDNFIKYKYTPIINIPLIKQLIVFIFTFAYTLNWIIKNRTKNRTIICSATRLYNSIPAFLLGKIFRLKLTLIVCDIPHMTFYQQTTKRLSSKEKCSIFLSELFIYSFDLYILMTKEMNNIVNKRNKPSIIVEGFCDYNMKDIPNVLQNKNSKKIVLYAGGLFKKYGIDLLIQAFASLQIKNTELWLFGEGDIDKQLYNYDNVVFWGQKINSEVVKAEIEATVLVNPRLSNEEYTKYSFPSKTLEYMSTGTFTITTRLAGIPDEYFKYCGVFETENKEGFAKILKLYLSLDSSELHAKGLKAKDFVITDKNNISQSKKVITFISENL